MNIFVLDKNPALAATFQPDKMLVKMVLETAQLLSTAHRVLDGEKGNESLYKSTHVNHPCSIWTRQSLANYDWLYKHFTGLAAEFQIRFKKRHKSFEKLKKELLCAPKNIPLVGLTEFALAMPEQYRDPSDAVLSYRNYVINEKSYAEWNKYRKKPDWWK